MTLKRKFLAALFAAVFFFTGCVFVVPGKTDTKGDDDKKTEDENQPTSPVEDYVLDLSQISVWDSAGGFDATTGVLTINEQYKAGQIWLGDYDGSAYKYFEVCYENASHNFSAAVQCAGVEGSVNESADKRKSRVYVTLDPKHKSKIAMVFIQSPSTETFTVKIKSMKFTNKMEEDKIKIGDPVIDDKGTALLNSSVSAINLVKQMKNGWNLGNTLDARASWLADSSSLGLDSETCWGEVKTTKDIIHIGMANGYKTIRIPTTWHNHIVDDKYTIDPDWMKRVKQVVDWAIEDGYYVILNEHHSVYDNMNKPLKYKDGYIVRNNATDIKESKTFLKAVWTQISAAFNSSYDEHLIFETMNEPRNTGHEHEWQPGLKLSWCDNSKCSECIADYKILNEYNQICLDAIRASGGNNANRFVMIPSLCTGGGSPNHELFKMPQDSAHDKLILTIHDYALGSTKDQAKQTYETSMKNEVESTLGKLNTNYVQKGIPVVVGETGGMHIASLSERLKWIKHFTSTAASYGMSVVYWECGGDDVYSMSEFDRKNCKVRTGEEEFVKAFVAAMN